MTDPVQNTVENPTNRTRGIGSYEQNARKFLATVLLTACQDVIAGKDDARQFLESSKAREFASLLDLEMHLERLDDQVKPPRPRPDAHAGKSGFFTSAQLAEQAGCSTGAVLSCIKRGTLPAEKHGTRFWLIRCEDAERWLASRKSCKG